VHELRAERNVDVGQFGVARLRAQSRRGDEAVQVPRPARGSVEVDRMSAAEQPGHDRLRNARRQRSGDGRVRSGPALVENLDSRRRRRGVSGGYARIHYGG
jgi:hypothetical protein